MTCARLQNSPYFSTSYLEERLFCSPDICTLLFQPIRIAKFCITQQSQTWIYIVFHAIIKSFFFSAEEQDTLLASFSSSLASNSGGQAKKRKAPTCKKCGKPVKGHHRENNVLICSPQETE